MASSSALNRVAQAVLGDKMNNTTGKYQDEKNILKMLFNGWGVELSLKYGQYGQCGHICNSIELSIYVEVEGEEDKGCSPKHMNCVYYAYRTVLLRT